MSWKLTPFVAAAFAIASTGCATKKFVRQTVDPINTQVAQLDKRTAENAAAIKDLDEKTQGQIARVEEKANSADARAGQAGEKAAQAGSQATQAMERAQSAHSLAENGLSKTGQLERVVENLDNFQLASSKTVYFDFNKSTLKDEQKQELDALAQALGNQRRFVIEVQGFTDATGPADYNYMLSEKRADAVVRYLTTQHKVPVYRIHTLGLGKDVQVEDNKTREGRKLNRRVEIRIFTAKTEELAQASPVAQNK